MNIARTIAYMYYTCTYMYLLSEAQVDMKPSVQDAGVQCIIIPYTECTPTTTDTGVQCDIECPLFVSTPRIDCYSTSETELSDASRRHGYIHWNVPSIYGYSQQFIVSSYTFYMVNMPDKQIMESVYISNIFVPRLTNVSNHTFLQI